MEGWIKLYRQIQECDFLWNSDKEPFDRRSAWIDLLLLANHKDKRLMFRGKAITVKCGQRITSINQLAKRWHWGINRVRNFLDLLQGEEMLIRESDNTRTLLTIVNYQKYQGFADISESPTDGVTDGVIDGVTNIAQMESQMDSQMTNKNDKNDKNEKNDKKHIYGEYSHVRLTEPEYEKLISELGQDMTDECIKFLDEYIEMKGYKAKNHNLCIRKWVIDAVKRANKSNWLEKDYDMIRKWAEEG